MLNMLSTKHMPCDRKEENTWTDPHKHTVFHRGTLVYAWQAPHTCMLVPMHLCIRALVTFTTLHPPTLVIASGQRSCPCSHKTTMSSIALAYSSLCLHHCALIVLFTDPIPTPSCTIHSCTYSSISTKTSSILPRSHHVIHLYLVSNFNW